MVPAATSVSNVSRSLASRAAGSTLPPRPLIEFAGAEASVLVSLAEMD
jgi:hypothetical protein